jgi:hypothetical protein
MGSVASVTGPAISVKEVWRRIDEREGGRGTESAAVGRGALTYATPAPTLRRGWRVAGAAAGLWIGRAGCR